MTERRRFAPIFVLLPAALAVLFAACGGDGDSTAGKGSRVTDPGLVPTSTPIGSNATLYQIRNDTISIVGGASASVTPNAQASAAARANYTILPGESCSVIAEKLGITVDALIKANRTINADCTNLKVGEQLKVPAAATTPAPGAVSTAKPSGREYTVVSGDDCGVIAASYGVEVKAFIALNGIDADCLNLKVGQTVRIP